MSKVIFVALEKEFSMDLAPEDYNVVYTGIGKINATSAVARYLTANPHTHTVYNYGTAGAEDASVSGELLGVKAVLERDMDLTPLGYAKYVTEQRQIPYLYTANKNTNVICGTGDSFARPTEDYHIVDMEAYAILSVCQDFDIGDVYVYKYISDTSEDEDPGESWKKNVSKGAKKFKKLLT
jgi:adenosylhomocysteine nucleosidase